MTPAQVAALGIKEGDRITFTASTRSGRRKVTRVVVGFTQPHGWPQVRYEGWDTFQVGWAMNDIIHSVEPKEAQ